MKLERPVWPAGYECAAMITLNLNAELFWLDLDPDCADKPKTLSLGQYGMNRGLDRILDILDFPLPEWPSTKQIFVSPALKLFSL